VVRIVAFALAGLVAAAGPAAADQRGDLQAKGEQLAKEGRFGEAIDQFKAADRIEPRASHACLVALAYTRKEQWPQAELFLALCHKRATPTDPLPEWVPEAEKQLKDRLASARVTEVTIEVKPADANPRVTVSSFAPDEVFEPQTIHLPLGTHVVFAKADGYADKQYTLEIKDRSPQHVVIDLAAPTPTDNNPMVLPEVPEQPPAHQPSRLGMYVMIGGGVVGVLGVISHISMAAKRNKIDEDKTEGLTADEWEAGKPAFESARTRTIILYAVSAGALVTGYLLHRKAKNESAVQVGAAPLPEGGAYVSLEWAR
jgi:hypothetical protein